MDSIELDEYFINQEVPYVKPFYSIAIRDDQEILKWFKDTDDTLQNYFRPLFNEQRRNLKLFLGAGLNPKYINAEIADFINYNEDADQTDAIYINELYRYTMDQVATIVSNELTVQVIPNNIEFSDKMATMVTKQWLDSISYDLKIDIMRTKWEIQKKIFGEAFVIPQWNPDKGDLKQDIMDLFGKGDEDGVVAFMQLDEEGRPLPMNDSIRVGDVDFENPLPYHVIIDPQQKYDDAEWFYWISFKDIYYLKKKFPKLNFSEDTNRNYQDAWFSEDVDPKKKKIYNFYHKPNAFLPYGWHIICTSDVVIKSCPVFVLDLINSQKLPIARFTDLDYGFGIRGTPILYRNLLNIEGGYNKISNQIYNNLEIESPKIIVHETAAFDGRRMPTGIAVFEYRGNVEPKIVTPSTNTTSIFKFREELKKNMDEMARQTPMVRGDTPNAQLDSFVALQHFEDLRQQLASPDIKNHNDAMATLYRLLIVFASSNYKKEDQRLLKIIGKNNKVELSYFDPENLMRSYDVRITTTGNLANTKAARTQLMINIKKDFPHLIQDTVFMDVLGLSHSEKMITSITTAVNAAEAENQDMLSGIRVEPPEKYEDLITHWDIHRVPLQSLDWKHSDERIKEALIYHMEATEKLMFEMAKEDITGAFKARLSTLPQFPLMYTPEPVNMPQPIQAQGEGGGETLVPEEEAQTPPSLIPQQSEQGVQDEVLAQ